MTGEAPVTVAPKGTFWVTGGAGYPPQKCRIRNPQKWSIVSGKY